MHQLKPQAYATTDAAPAGGVGAAGALLGSLHLRLLSLLSSPMPLACRPELHRLCHSKQKRDVRYQPAIQPLILLRVPLLRVTAKPPP